jgi:galactonate dehydratase
MPVRSLAITDVQCWPVQQPHDRRVYVVLKVTTDAGITGWGELRVQMDAAAVVRALEACREVLIGQDAVAVEPLRRVLENRRQVEEGEGAVVQAGINMAQLDILGKASSAPAYEVLGGPTRNKARALAPLVGDTDDALLASLTQIQKAGYRAARVPLTIPTGPIRGRGFFERTRQLFDRLRSASSGDVDFVLDCAGRTTHAEAAALASAMEGFHLLWLDEPMSRIQVKALSGLGEESATPIGWGRDATANSEFQDLLRQDAVDVLRPDIGRMGITAIRKAAAIAETYYVAMAPSHEGGPIGTAAALHVAASIPNFFIQEVPFAFHDADRNMRRELAGDLESPQDGFLPLPVGPGLGVTISESALQKYRIKV